MVGEDGCERAWRPSSAPKSFNLSLWQNLSVKIILYSDQQTIFLLLSHVHI